MQFKLDISTSTFSLFMRWAIVSALSVLLISMATGQYGISNYRELLRNKTELEQLNMRISIENQLLDEKIAHLKASKDVQMHYLKESFGYVAKGEVLYRFPKKANSRVSENSPKNLKIVAVSKNDI